VQVNQWPVSGIKGTLSINQSINQSGFAYVAELLQG